MSNTKHKIFRLLEHYMNKFRADAVQEIYGVNSYIKIHNMNFSLNEKSVLVEAVVILGDTINENTVDRQLADILIQDAIFYFYPEHSIKAYVRFDV